MFRLVTSVKRGTACGLPGSWQPYLTIEQARTAADALLRQERVTRVMIVTDTLPMSFVEWRDSASRS